MADFKPEEFVEDPDPDLLEHLTKDQLLCLGQHLGLGLKRALRKPDIIAKIMQDLISKGLIEESEVETSESDSLALQLELKKS